MMSNYIILFLVYNTFMFGETAFVDTLTPCKKDDYVCHKESLENSIQLIANTGIPEIGLPPIDPAPLKNITVDILDVFRITLIEGQSSGAKGCKIQKFETNYEKGQSIVELTCPVVSVEGKYSLTSTSPVLEKLFSGRLHGDGYGKIQIEKVNIRAELFFHIEKRNGDVYVKAEIEKVKYTYDINGNVLFSADNLYLGNEESSAHVIKILNENWNTLIPAFGKYFADKVVKWAMNLVDTFFHEVPVKSFISDDLSEYIKK